MTINTAEVLLFVSSCQVLSGSMSVGHLGKQGFDAAGR